MDAGEVVNAAGPYAILLLELDTVTFPFPLRYNVAGRRPDSGPTRANVREVKHCVQLGEPKVCFAAQSTFSFTMRQLSFVIAKVPLSAKPSVGLKTV